MKTGILLINTGTPDSPSVNDVRRYLREFLNDPRVMDISWLLRLLLVNLVIVPFRSSRSAKLYEKIWTREGSPLLVHCNKLKEKLQNELKENYVVELGMRYQKPRIENALNKLMESKVKRIIILPLFPQYASSSTGTSIEKALRIISKWKVIPSIQVINQFYYHPGFVNSFAEIAKQYDLNSYDHILFSYHGLPERHIKKSSEEYGSSNCTLRKCCDEINSNNQYCYRAACFHTSRLIAGKLNISEDRYTTCFQSRLGKTPWIKPYSEKVIFEKARLGVKTILVFSPSFVADCLETIYEIGIEYNHLFQYYGGKKIQLAESLNANEKWIGTLKEIITEQSIICNYDSNHRILVGAN